VRNHPRFRFIYGDGRSAKNIGFAVKDADAVVHLGGLLQKECNAEPSLAFEVNLGGTIAVAKACERRGVKRLLYASSASCYGKTDEGVKADENAPLLPLTIYAHSKSMAEEPVLDFGGVVMRFATVYGLSPRMRFDLIVNQFAMQAAVHGKLELYNPDAWRSHVHVGDLARAVALLLQTTEDVEGEVFNVGGYNRRKGELVKALGECAEFEVNVQQVAGDVRDYQVDFGKLARLGFVPETPPEKAMAEIVDCLNAGWFRNPLCKRHRSG